MAAAASSSSDTTNDGPVLSLINKRLRALRKKLNRITQMEESLSQGKTLNKEQDETLRSKSSVLVGIDELEKLRQPLSEAVSQEISLALEKQPKPETKESHDEEVREPDMKEVREPDMKGGNGGVSAIPDLLNLLYFGSVFDVKTLMRAHENMITRTHERSSCLTYDYVTDDDAAGDPLKEWDLDLISMLGGLLISRPLNSSLPHKNALEKCVEHARLWLANSEQPIDPNSDVTYAGLREKLDKIMASEYFTTTPAIKAPFEVAAAAENYTSFQVPVHGSVIPAGVTVPVEGSASEYQPPEEESPISSHGNEIYDDKTGSGEEIQQGGSEIEDGYDVQVQTDLATPDTEVDQNSRDLDLNEQQYATRRPPQNYRGGRGGGGGGGRRGYLNGRGGRGNGRGGYQNGRSQFYDQAGSYYPRNNYNYRGRGGRGMGSNYNYHATADLARHVQAAS